MPYICAQMKQLALFFAFIIFSQSLSVCAPDLYFQSISSNNILSAFATDTHCDSKTKSCCKKTDLPSGEDEHQDGKCCGENCHCFTCIKVFTKNLNTIDLIDQLRPIIVKNISPVFFHSFDYHSDQFHPPQING